MTDVTPPPAPQSTPAWEDLLNVLTSPTAVFTRRKDDPTFFIPMLIFTAVFAVLVFASWDLMDQVRHADQARAMAGVLRNNPNMTPEQIEQVQAQMGGGGSIGRYLGGLAAPLIILFVGLYAWLAAKMVGARTTMGQAFMVATFAFTPKVIGFILSIILAVALPEAMLDGQFRLTLGPGLLIDPDTMRGSYIFALARFELSTVWYTALIALGIKATGDVPTGKAAVAGVITWILGGLLMTGVIFLGEMAQGIK
jgi:hypothetical protein